jgi:hypothetical protein
VLPTGSLELIVDLAHDSSMPIVCGAMSQAAAIDTIPAAVGARFKPAGALPFLDAPAGELRDVELPLSIFWGNSAGKVRERPATAESPSATLQVLERAMLAHLSGRIARDPSVAFASKEFRNRGSLLAGGTVLSLHLYRPARSDRLNSRR